MTRFVSRYTYYIGITLFFVLRSRNHFLLNKDGRLEGLSENGVSDGSLNSVLFF